MIDLELQASDSHKSYLEHGFSDDDIVLSAKIVMEVSEVLECVRDGTQDNWADHISRAGLRKIDEEVADILLLGLILAKKHNVPIQKAILAKHEYNMKRPMLHGKLW